MICNALVLLVKMLINISLTRELLSCQAEAFSRLKHLDDAENSVKLIIQVKLTQDRQEIRNKKDKKNLQRVLWIEQRDLHNHWYGLQFWSLSYCFPWCNLVCDHEGKVVFSELCFTAYYLFLMKKLVQNCNEICNILWPHKNWVASCEKEGKLTPDLHLINLL